MGWTDMTSALWFKENIKTTDNPNILCLTDTSHHEVLILTPWRRVFLEKLIVAQLVRKIPAFYGV
jgi:hypothetical protein